MGFVVQYLHLAHAAALLFTATHAQLLVTELLLCAVDVAVACSALWEVLEAHGAAVASLAVKGLQTRALASGDITLGG